MPGAQKRTVTRREFLRGTTVGAGLLATGALLAACAAQSPAPAATSAPPAAAPTQAPKPATAAPAATQPVKLVQWDSNPAPVRTLTYKIAADTFHAKHPNVTIEYVPVPIANYQEKLIAAVSAGTPPDIADIWFNWGAQFVGMKALLSLEPFLPSWEKLKDYSPAHMVMSRFMDNRAYVLAGDIFFQGTHYRKDLVKEAGLDDPRELDSQGKWDWQAFNKVAKALHKPEKNFYGVSMRGGVGADFTIFNMMMSATKGKWFDDKGVCLLNSPEALAALEWYAGLVTDLKVCQPSAASDGFQEFTNNFFNGLAGMMIHNDDGIAGLQRLGREKYATAQMPASPAGMYMGMVGYGFSVMAGTKYPEIAAQYVFHRVQNWVEHGYQANKEMGQETLIMTSAPMISDLQRDMLKDPLYAPFYDVPNKNPERSFVNPYWLPEYAGITARTVVADFQKVLTGKMKPKEAADRWAEEFTKAQKDYLAKR